MEPSPDRGHDDELEVVDRNELWREDGASCMASWLGYCLGLAFRTAAEWVEIAHALTRLPAIAAAYDAGKRSWDRLRAAAAIATPETDDDIADLAQRVSVAELESAARRAKAARRDGPTENRGDRYLIWSQDKNSWLRLRGHLPPDQGAAVTAALERLQAQVPRLPNGMLEMSAARAADALVELASTRLAEDSDADRATVVIHVDESVLAGGEGVAEIASGELLDGATAQRFACDARLQFVTHDSKGKVTGIGRASRKVPPWLMRQIRRRDGTCRFPGCARKRFVQAHHITHWPRGGPTDLDNLVMLCGYHHDLVRTGAGIYAAIQLRKSSSSDPTEVCSTSDHRPSGPSFANACWPNRRRVNRSSLWDATSAARAKRQKVVRRPERSRACTLRRR